MRRRAARRTKQRPFSGCGGPPVGRTRGHEIGHRRQRVSMGGHVARAGAASEDPGAPPEAPRTAPYGRCRCAGGGRRRRPGSGPVVRVRRPRRRPGGVPDAGPRLGSRPMRALRCPRAPPTRHTTPRGRPRSTPVSLHPPPARSADAVARSLPVSAVAVRRSPGGVGRRCSPLVRRTAGRGAPMRVPKHASPRDTVCPSRSPVLAGAGGGGGVGAAGRRRRRRRRHFSLVSAFLLL